MLTVNHISDCPDAAHHGDFRRQHKPNRLRVYHWRCQAISKHICNPRAWSIVVMQRNINSTTFAVEINLTVNQRKQCVIIANAHVPTWMPLGTALPNQDIPGCDIFPAKFFDTSSLRMRVTPIACGPLSLLMRHSPAPAKLLSMSS